MAEPVNKQENKDDYRVINTLKKVKQANKTECDTGGGSCFYMDLCDGTFRGLKTNSLEEGGSSQMDNKCDATRRNLVGMCEELKED